MKTKHLVILGIIFAALLGAVLIQKIYQGKIPAGEPRGEMWKPFIPTDQAARIVFSKSAHPPLALSREENRWKVDSLSGAAADAHKVNRVLEQLNQIQAEWRAEGESYFDRFGVADDQAFQLKVFNTEGGGMLDFYIGVKRSGQGVFIRLAGGSKIYFVNQDLPALFGLYADLEPAVPLPIFFADLRLVPENFEQIQRFDVTEFRNGEKAVRAALERPSVKAGTPWEFVEGLGSFKPGFEKVENYLIRLTGAHGENIVSARAGWEPDFEIMLRDGRGKVERIEFSKIKDTAGTGKAERWLAKRESSPQIFEVSGLVVEDLKTQNAVLIEDNPLRVEVDPGYSVEMRDEKRSEIFSHESGWPTAAAILDALTRLRFLRVEPGIAAADLEGFPPTHQIKIKKLGVDFGEIRFYAADPRLKEIKAVINGQNTVYVVSRAFFETLFIPETEPQEEDANESQAAESPFIML